MSRADREVSVLLVQDLLAGYAPAWPFSDDGTPATWDDAIAVTALDELESARVDELAHELTERGIDDPVLLDAGGCDPDLVSSGECSGQPSCCPPRVLNGMHRVLAHVSAGAQVIKVTFDPGRASEDWTETAVRVLAPEGDQWWDDLASLLSFRLDDQTWVECDGVAMLRRAGAEHWLTIPWCGYYPGRNKAIEEAVRERLPRAGLQVLDVTSRTVYYDQ